MKKNNINFASVSINNLSAEGGCTMVFKGVKVSINHTKEVDGINIFEHTTNCGIGQISLEVKGEMIGRGLIKAAKDIVTGKASLDATGVGNDAINCNGNMDCELTIKDMDIAVYRKDLDCKTYHSDEDKNEKFESLQATHDSTGSAHVDELVLSGSLKSVCEGIIQVKGQIEDMVTENSVDAN